MLVPNGINYFYSKRNMCNHLGKLKMTINHDSEKWDQKSNFSLPKPVT